MTTKIINMLSGPGSGKSTLAAELFVHMKKEGYRVEYLQEYAKTLVWQEKFEILNNQHLVSYKYYRLIKAMSGCVDYIILDSSLLNGLWYNRNNPDNLSNVKKTEKLILKYYHEFENINYYIDRGNLQYETAGRIQTEDESKHIDKDIKSILKEYEIEYRNIVIDQDNVMDDLMKSICQ